MKRILLTLGLLGVLGAGAATAQTRVSVSIRLGAPFVIYHPRPHRYHSYVVYHPRPTLVVVRPYRPARVVVVRPRPGVKVRHHPRRHYRHW